MARAGQFVKGHGKACEVGGLAQNGSMRFLIALMLVALTGAAWAEGPMGIGSDTLADKVFKAPQFAAECKGGNVSPQVVWDHSPEGAKSFAVSIFDKDAKGGKGFWHWMVYDLPADTAGLAEDASMHLPDGVKQTLNDFGKMGYGGPCPPAGETHHYVISVVALDIEKLPVYPDATAEQVAEVAKSHMVQKSVMVVTAKRD
jgi:hypothetical protein